METKIEAKPSKPKATSASRVPIRVKQDTRRKIIAELAKLNKKDFGRQIKADDLIALALTLIESKHLEQLRDASLTNADRLESLYRAHVRQHGSLSKDAFLGKLLAGETASGNSKLEARGADAP